MCLTVAAQGGADYAMLFAVKHGWMSPLTEKRYNSAINVWVREPALVVTATLGFVQMHAQKIDDLSGWGVGAVRVFLMLLAMWNGLFFMERVVGNYHVCEYKEKLKQQQRAIDPNADPSSPLLTSVPASGGRFGASSSGGSGGSGGGGGAEVAAAKSVYESSDHFTPSLPFMGMRVSVSREDLRQVKSQPPHRLPDAYPTNHLETQAASAQKAKLS